MFNGCLYFNLNGLTRRINAEAERVFALTGLSPPQAYLLRVILAEPGLTSGEAAARLLLAPSTVTRFADALLARGLLQKRPGGDARQVVLYPSDEGVRLGEQVEACARRLADTLKILLGDDSFVRLVQDVRLARIKLEGGGLH